MSPTASTVMATVVASVARLLLSFAVLGAEKNWTMGDLVKVEEGERVKGIHRLYDLQDPFRTRNHKVLRSVSDAVALADGPMDDAMVSSLSGAGPIVVPRIDKLTGQLASTRVAVVSLMTKLSDLGQARHKMVREHDNVLRRIRTKKITTSYSRERRCCSSLSWRFAICLGSFESSS